MSASVSVASVVEPHRQEAAPAVAKAASKKLSFYYGDFRALKDINLVVHEQRVTALIGPSGCGKSTFLRCFNRMHDLYPGNRYQGEIRLYPDDTNLLAPGVDPIEVRMRLSMVFQKPNPFPKSIFENVAYGLRVRGERCATRRSGMRSRIGSATLPSISRAASSSAFASRARWRPTPRSCSSTSRPRRSTRSPRPASRS